MNKTHDVAYLLRNLNSELFNSKRFMIVSLLYIFGKMKLSELRKILGLSWGDLDTHIKKLVEQGYVELWKEPGEKKVLETVAYLTGKGRQEYEKLYDVLRAISSQIETK